MQNENLKVVEIQIATHEKQITDLGVRLNELSTSHQETVFILKTYMENFKTFGAKIDDLAEVVKDLMPGRKDWEFEKRLEAIEERQMELLKYKKPLFICIAILFVSVAAPELIPPLFEYLKLKVPHA